MYTHIFETPNFCVSAYKLMKFDVVRLKFVKLSFLISICKENLYAKMKKLEAQVCRCTREDLRYALVHIPLESVNSKEHQISDLLCIFRM